MATPDPVTMTWTELGHSESPIAPVSEIGRTWTGFPYATGAFGQLTAYGNIGSVAPPVHGVDSATSWYRANSNGTSSVVNAALVATDAPAWTIPFMAVACSIGPAPADAATSTDIQCGCGIAFTSTQGSFVAGEGVFIAYSYKNSQCSLIVAKGGTFNNATAIATTAQPHKIALQYNYNGQASVYVLYKEGTGWQLLKTIDLSAQIDPTNATILAALRPALYMGYNATASANFVYWPSFIAGYGGVVGIRDLSPVIYEDGTPYIYGGYVYMVGTVIYPVLTAAYEYKTSCGMVFRFRLSDLQAGRRPAVEQTAFIISRVGDAGPALVRNRLDNTWLTSFQGFADYAPGSSFQNHLRSGTLPSTTDVLNTLGSTPISTFPTTQMSLASTTSTWDIALNWDGANWNVVYTETNTLTVGSGWQQRIAYDKGPTLTSLVRQSQSAFGGSGGIEEGSCLQKIGGTLYAISAYTSLGIQPYEVFNLSGLSSARGQMLIGNINYSAAGGVYVPHPVVIPLPTNALATGRTPGTTYYMVPNNYYKINATQTLDSMGQVFYLRANETSATDEYAFADAAPSTGSGGASDRCSIGF